MKNKAIFSLLLSLFLCNAETLQFNSIEEFRKSLAESQNKKTFIETYLKEITQ